MNIINRSAAFANELHNSLFTTVSKCVLFLNIFYFHYSYYVFACLSHKKVNNPFRFLDLSYRNKKKKKKKIKIVITTTNIKQTETETLT